MAGIYVSDDVTEMSAVRVNIHGIELKIAEFSCPPVGGVLWQWTLALNDVTGNAKCSWIANSLSWLGYVPNDQEVLFVLQ